MNRKPIGVTAPYRKDGSGQKPVAYQDTAKPTELVAAEDWDNIDPQWHYMYRGLYTSDQINAKLEAMAVECERMPFGDTAQSFAAWIRGQKL